MFTFRTTFCLLVLLLGSSGTSFAQNEGDDSPKTPISFGKVGVKDGNFWLTEFKYVEALQTVTYTVQVPYTEQVKQEYSVTIPDGSTITRERMVSVQKWRMETRERMAPGLQPNSYAVPDEAISFSTVLGKPVNDLEGVRKMLQKESRPAVIKMDPRPIEAFYEAVLNSKLVVVNVNPNGDTDAFINRGHELFNQKEYAKALAEFDWACRISPLSPQPWNNKAWRLATWPDKTIRDGEAAVAAAKKGVELVDKPDYHASWDNERAFVHRTLAAAYAAAGDFDQATTTVEAAIKLLTPEQKQTEEDFQRNRVLFSSKQVLIDDLAGTPRIVMDSTGQIAFQATLVSLNGDKVTLKKLDGNTIDVPLSKLSESDRLWARQAK